MHNSVVPLGTMESGQLPVPRILCEAPQKIRSSGCGCLEAEVNPHLIVYLVSTHPYVCAHLHAPALGEPHNYALWGVSMLCPGNGASTPHPWS